MMIAVALNSCGNKSGKLTMIVIAPSEKMIAKGTKHQFNATAIFSDGAMLNWDSAATWSTSDESSVTVSNDFGSYGLASSLKSGTTRTITITATDLVNGISGTAQLIVAEPLSIDVHPHLPFMLAGTHHQFTATAILADLASGASSTISVELTSSPTISWFSDNTDVANVNTRGVVTAGTTTGPVAITALDLASSVSGSTLLTVTDSALKELLVTSATSTMMHPGDLISLTAVGTLENGATNTYTESANWSSMNKAIATVSNTVGSKGLVTAGTRTGTTTIKAVDPITGKPGSTFVTVE